jgi:calcineurin-like phosphoesterase family protein
MIHNHYFISDLHLGHANVIKHDNRPFADIDEHDKALITNASHLGMPNRTLWVLGDVAHDCDTLRLFMRVQRRCWGKIMLIRGNHDDRVAWKLRSLFDEAHESRYLRVDRETKVYLSHYAHRTWRNSHHGAYHLHGHSHGALPRIGRSMDVGANCIGYSPISLATCIAQLHKQNYTNHH